MQVTGDAISSSECVTNSERLTSRDRVTSGASAARTRVRRSRRCARTSRSPRPAHRPHAPTASTRLRQRHSLSSGPEALLRSLRRHTVSWAKRSAFESSKSKRIRTQSAARTASIVSDDSCGGARHTHAANSESKARDEPGVERQLHSTSAGGDARCAQHARDARPEDALRRGEPRRAAPAASGHNGGHRLTRSLAARECAN